MKKYILYLLLLLTGAAIAETPKVEVRPQVTAVIRPDRTPTADDKTWWRQTIGVIIGADVQAYQPNLTVWGGKTVPAGTIADLSSAQTFTNKTFTSPTITGGSWTGGTDLAVADGGTGASTAATARVNLGLEVGVDIQPHSAFLDAWSSRGPPTGTVVGTTDTQTLAGKTLTSPTINGGTLTNITDLSVADGGTGASTAAGARTNLGVPSIATSADVAPLDFVFWGDSFTAGLSNQVPYPTQFRDNWKRGATENRGVGGETSIQVKTRFDALPDRWVRPTIIMVGRNNFSSPTQVKADIAGMVASLNGAQGGNAQYLIGGITNSSDEIIGTTNYNLAVSLNSDLATIYGSKFVDIRKPLINAYNPGNAQDVIDFGNDVTPFSLRVTGDGLHPNTAGNKVISDTFYNAWVFNYPLPGGGITMQTALALLTSPYDSRVPYRMTSLTPIFAVNSLGLTTANTATLSTTSNGDFFLHGNILGDQQNDVGGPLAANHFNRGFYKTALFSPLLQPDNGSGTNGAGVDLALRSGYSTGTGASGKVGIWTSPTGSSGTASNTTRLVGYFDSNSLWLFDPSTGTPKQITFGLPDSAGTGFKTLKMAN